MKKLAVITTALFLSVLVGGFGDGSWGPKNARADWVCYTSFSIVHGWQVWCYDNGGGGGGGGFKFMRTPQ